MSKITKQNKRTESTKKYIDELQKNYSKLNVVRIDLSYKKPHSKTMKVEDMEKDIKHMFNNMRCNPNIYGDKVGYIMKKEYTQDKGPHIHAAFFFDGQKVQKSTHKAEQIGQYWQKNITNGKGSYHNCHRNRYERNGIGMLEHNDKEKRKRLDEDVILYLCKDDPKQDITQLKTTKRAKAFVRGALPEGKKKVGRPRKEEK